MRDFADFSISGPNFHQCYKNWVPFEVLFASLFITSDNLFPSISGLLFITVHSRVSGFCFHTKITCNFVPSRNFRGFGKLLSKINLGR